MRQADKILDYIKKNGKITTMTAFRVFGCTRLPARISDLRSEGHKIKTNMVTKKNARGESHTFAEYTLS